MALLKINGERNSGTNFLYEILDKNKFPVYSHRRDNKTNIIYHWKHRIPDDDYKHIRNKKVIDIFIFRELDGWLASMNKNVYHLKKIHDFKDFLLNNQISNEQEIKDYKTMDIINKDDNNKTIFDIRYYKFNKINEYKNRNNDVIFVNLTFLQDKNNMELFLNELNSRYFENKYNPTLFEINHIKRRHMSDKNRKYNIDIEKYREIIDSKKNDEIEKYINNLTFEIK